MTSKTTTRNGRSLVTDINSASSKLLKTLGFTEEKTQRMIQVRRVLPLVIDRQEPCIDARKLWERIGKPHGRFRDWAESYIKPLLASGKGAEKSAALIGEILPFTEAVGKTKQPRQNYTLSRDCAAHLAMMARTPEGHSIRQYFIDMEELTLKLAERMPARVRDLIKLDNEATAYFRKKTGQLLKDGHLSSRHEAASLAADKERLLKSFVCEILTDGIRAGEWRKSFKAGIRDTLDTDDLLLYTRCYDTAVTLVRSGMATRDQLELVLKPSFGGHIDVDKYLQKQEQTEVA